MFVLRVNLNHKKISIRGLIFFKNAKSEIPGFGEEWHSGMNR